MTTCSHNAKKRMNIHYLQHVPFEGPAFIEGWAHRHGHTLSRTRLFANEPLPNLERFDCLLILGGPMSIHDELEHIWLKAEKWFVRQVIDSGKPLLGICLGAQLIADALGARVYRGEQKEIGWYPVELTPEFIRHPLGTKLPEQLTPLHWHGETFELPEGAIRMASSAVTRNQGFLYHDRVCALQFHLEATQASAAELAACCADELQEEGMIQGSDEILADAEHFNAAHRHLEAILDYLLQQAG